MADNKKSFISYCDWGDIFDELEDDEAGRLVKHLFDYVRDKNPEPKDKLTKMMFIQIKQSLKRDLVKYDKYIDKQKVNGSKGGRPPKNPEAPKEPNPLLNNPVEPKKADTVTVTDTVNDSGTVSDIVTKPKLSIVYSNEVHACFNKCLISFEKHLHPKNEKEKLNWLDTIDKLNRIDGIELDLIARITKHIRKDAFWAKNFLSLNKLRKNNKDGIMFIVVFHEQLKSKSNGKNKQVTSSDLSDAHRRFKEGTAS